MQPENSTELRAYLAAKGFWWALVILVALLAGWSLWLTWPWSGLGLTLLGVHETLAQQRSKP